MSDNKSKQGIDRSRISLEQDYEVRYWTQELGVSRPELEEAISAVGNTSEKVRAHLGRTKSGKANEQEG